LSGLILELKEKESALVRHQKTNEILEVRIINVTDYNVKIAFVGDEYQVIRPARGNERIEKMKEGLNEQVRTAITK